MYDVIIIGSGSGGYVAAIRASQLGMKVAVIEKAELGGTCLNWGCIPTKALLKSAQVYEYLKNAESYGIKITSPTTHLYCGERGEIDFPAIIKRSRDVADKMSKGVQYLFKKNKIDIIQGFGKIKPEKLVEVSTNEGLREYSAEHIIIATGARAREPQGLVIDNKKIISYKDALTLTKQPESMLIVGAGPIGCEFAYFYNSIGTKVTLVEIMPNIVPTEDDEISKELSRIFRRIGIDVLTESYISDINIHGFNVPSTPGSQSKTSDFPTLFLRGYNKCKTQIISKTGEQTCPESSRRIVEADVVLSSVGLKSNIENIGLEEVGIAIEKDKIVVDEYYQTNIAGYYAIGDIVKGPALAHVASAEAIICVEKIAGHNPEPLDYDNIPMCIYTSPEIASVGLTEKKAKDSGYEIKVGKFPFIASGKANASGAKDGFVKMIFNAKTDEILGAHLIGANVTEIIAEIVVARKLNAKGKDILRAIHPHPTMNEAIMEATATAYGEAIHL